MTGQMIIWRPRTAAPELEELGRQALALGGRQALTQWAGTGEVERSPQRGNLAHVHGERHDLWWEFSLEASFRWQAHLHQMPPDLAQARLRRLTRALGLDTLLSREVASLTHSARALADLAVALLPRPALLLWEEPFYLLGQGDAARAARLVRELCDEGMTLVAVAAEPPLLGDLEAAAATEAAASLAEEPFLRMAR